MGKYTSLALGIINNPSAHVVNREQKMSDTVDVMVDNIDKKIARSKNMKGHHNAAEVRGYGLNRNTRD